MMSRVAGRWLLKALECFAVVAAWLVFAAAEGRSQESAAPPKTPKLNETLTLDLSSEAAFHLNNDTTLRRWLKDGRSRLDAGQISEGLTLWQRILDRGDDGFVKLRADGQWLEVRGEVLRGLSELPPEGQATYERLFGTAARHLFEQSSQTGRSVFATETMRRYFHTAAGFESARWLAAHWLDKGETRVAARLFERLLSEPVHRERLTPNLMVQAAVAQRLAGNDVRARELLDKLGATNILIAGEERSATQLAEQLVTQSMEVMPKALASASREWLTAGGNFARNAAPSGSVPWLKPLWTPVSLAANSSDRAAIQDWLVNQDEHNTQQIAVAIEPIVVRGQLVVRELNGVSAFDLRTGRRLWMFPASLPFSEWLPRAMAQAGETDRFRTVRDGFVTNSACGMLSSDGRHVFAIDLIPWRSQPAGNKDVDEDSGKRELDLLTQLVALPIETGTSNTGESPVSQVRPAWTLDGMAAASKLGHRGCGIQFLGAPAVVDERLFVMGELFSFDEFTAEKNNQLCLIAIDGSNGEPLWCQGLALVDEPFFKVRQRSRRNPVGSPTVSDGMLICPTDVGLFVGVDLVTGRQRWVHGYHIGEAGGRRELFPESFGWDGTPTWPVIHRDRALLLSRFSEELHCVETTTGKLLWQLPRGNAVYIGAVTDDRIVLVGERDVRAIPVPADGMVGSSANSAPQKAGPANANEPLWTHLVGPVTGRGVRVGDDLLVPLKSGRVACLDLATGHDRGFAVTRTIDLAAIRRGSRSEDERELAEHEFAPWPGNLIACDDVVVSLGLGRVAVYPQARAVLASLRDRPDSVERRLLESELRMLLGSEASPVIDLKQVLQSELSPELRQQAERQLRESLYLELSRNPDRADELLPQLERLADTTGERARLLQRICEVSLPRDPVRTVQAARDLAALSLDHELELDEHGQHVVSLDTWARGFLRQVRGRVANAPDDTERVNDLLNQERDVKLKSSDVDELRQFARLCDDWPQASDVRLRLADLLLDRGEFQEAELLLARDRLSTDPQVAAAATARMLRLWDHLGFYSLAANLLGELEDRFGEVEFSIGDSLNVTSPTHQRGAAAENPSLVRRASLTGRTFVAAFSRDSMTWQAFARRQRPNWDVRRVVISEDRPRTGELRLVEGFGNGDIRNRTLVRAGIGVHLFQTQSLFRPLQEPGWQIVDRDSGVVTGLLPQLDRYYPTGLQAGAPAGVNHFFPVGGPGRMLGFSLLGRGQTEAAWETAFVPLRVTQEFLRVGPVGPGFCVYQSRQHLIVVDPATGRVTWRRELEPHSGLLGESETGLFGDREALFVFGSDQSVFTVYETATGREIRQGRLPVDQHQSRRAFGRRLFHIIEVNGVRRMRIWDPLTDRNELDEALPQGTSAFSPQVTRDGELLLVLRSGRVRVIDVHNSLVKLDVTLPESDVRGANMLRAFSDSDRYYLNLQRVLDNSNRMSMSYFLNETLVPNAEVLGELYAFERPAIPQPLDGVTGMLGRKLWMRTMPQRTILRLDIARLPFLIALARQQDRTRSDKSALRVEAIDALSGDLLGSSDHVLPTRLVQTQHDPAAARVTLVGLSTRITLDYGREKQRLVRQETPW